MDRSEVITFVSIPKEQNKYGVWVDGEPVYREVFVQVDSVSRQEFFDAGREGLNPEYRFTLFAYDYNGEQTCVYKGNQYAIYRTFRGRNDTLELYVERKGGTNG